MIRSRAPFRTKAIILKTYKSGDADRIIVLFTEKYGKLKGMMKGIRKASCKFRACTEVGTVVDVSLYYKDKHQELGRITGMDPLDALLQTRKDYSKILTLTYLMNIMDEAWPLQDTHPEMFSLLCLTLSELEKELSESHLRGMIRAFELRTLTILGIHPTLETCSTCSEEISSPPLFRFRDLSVICGSCAKKNGITASCIRLTDSFLTFYGECTNLTTPLPLQELDSKTERLARLFFRKIFMDFLGHHLNVLKVTYAMRRNKNGA